MDNDLREDSGVEGWLRCKRVALVTRKWKPKHIKRLRTHVGLLASNLRDNGSPLQIPDFKER
jgi:hypothetical protein